MAKRPRCAYCKKPFTPLKRGRARTTRFFEMLDRHLAGRQFEASDRYTIADILALVTVNFASRINLAIPEDCSQLRRLH